MLKIHEPARSELEDKQAKTTVWHEGEVGSLVSRSIGYRRTREHSE